MDNPKIRFKGFTDAWEQRKLLEFGKATGGTSIESEFSENGIYKVISIGSYSENSIYRDQGLRAVESEKTLNRILNKGDITMILNDKTTSGNIIGRVLLIEKSGVYVYNQRTERIELDSNNYDSQFIYTMLNAPQIRDKIIKQSQGNTQIYVNWPTISQTEYFVPHIKEQQQIGHYFRHLDYLITLHQRKCDKIKELKKYMLQKMFPQNDMNVPKIRFAGFTDVWEQRKLIDICDYVDYRGKTPTKTETGIFLVTAKNVKNGYIDYECSKEFISENDYEEVMHRGKPEIGDILITTEAPCGNVAQVNTINIALAQRIIKYRGHKNIIDNTYLKHYLLSPIFQKLLFEKSSGGTVQGIKGSILHQQNIQYPTFDEQIKIGQYLNNIDHFITLHQRKLEKLKNIKKFILQ